MLQVYLLYLIFLLTTAFALKAGGRAEQGGALWLFLNTAIQLVNELSGLHSTVVHLIADGVYAVGLLPAAVLYVSYWIGAQTLLSAVGFTLEAAYLLTDRPPDSLFVNLSNAIFAFMLLNLNIATAASVWVRRRDANKQSRLAQAAS